MQVIKHKNLFPWFNSFVTSYFIPGSVFTPTYRKHITISAMQYNLHKILLSSQFLDIVPTNIYMISAKMP